jgi:hypothetical protein
MDSNKNDKMAVAAKCNPRYLSSVPHTVVDGFAVRRGFFRFAKIPIFPFFSTTAK